MPAAATIDVLIVDDNEDQLELSSRALQRAGLTVKSAKNFGELDGVLAAGAPRLILMDVQMPEMFGDEVAEILREQRGVRAKVLLYSSLDSVVLERLARDAGLDGYLNKGDGIASLVAQVKKLLAGDGT